MTEQIQETKVLENNLNTPLDNKPQVENTESAAAQEQTQEHINWKKFREQREIERKEKEAALKRAEEKQREAEALREALSSALSKYPPYQQPQEYPTELSEDERIQKKIDEALFKERQKQEEYQRKKEQAEIPQKLSNTFSDFNQVCSSENLEYLEYHYPEITFAFNNSPDSFDKWAAVYKAVKRLVPNTNGKKDQKKAEQNNNKPQSMSVSGITQTGDTTPVNLDEKRRADNWARMQRVMKGG